MTNALHQRISTIVQLDYDGIDPTQKLAAAVVGQAIEDLYGRTRVFIDYPSEKVQRTKQKVHDERVRSAESFFLSDLCLPWIKQFTPEYTTPHEIRMKIMESALEWMWAWKPRRYKRLKKRWEVFVASGQGSEVLGPGDDAGEAGEGAGDTAAG